MLYNEALLARDFLCLGLSLHLPLSVPQESVVLREHIGFAIPSLKTEGWKFTVTDTIRVKRQGIAFVREYEFNYTVLELCLETAMTG